MSQGNKGIRVKKLDGSGRTVVVSPAHRRSTASGQNRHYYSGGNIGGVNFEPGYYPLQFWALVYLATVDVNDSGQALQPAPSDVTDSSSSSSGGYGGGYNSPAPSSYDPPSSSPSYSTNDSSYGSSPSSSGGYDSGSSGGGGGGGD